MKATDNLITAPIVDKYDRPIDPYSNWYRIRHEFRHFLFREKTRLPMRAEPNTRLTPHEVTLLNRNIAIVQDLTNGHEPAELAIKYHLSTAHIYKILKQARSHD